MIKLPSFGLIVEAISGAVKRFPGAALSAIVGVVAVCMLIDLNYDSGNEHTLVRLWMMAQLGLPLFVAIRLFAESRNMGALANWAGQGLGLAALIAYYFTLAPDAENHFEAVQLPRYFVWLIGAHLLSSVAAYLRPAEVRDFWEFNRQIFANFVVGALYAFVLFGGLAVAILAVDQLFDLDLDEAIYPRLFVIIFGLFLTIYFLWHTPKDFRFELEGSSVDAVLRNLCKYVLIPIVILYFLILYAYSAKILLAWNLPKGWVSSLALGFSIAGIFTWLLNFRLHEYDDNPLIRFFHRWFWWIVSPMTVLLFVAIGRRIADYGVTEPRFLVAHTGIWLALMCVYFLLSKKDDIRVIPISLAFFAVAFVYGPFNAFKVSEKSQMHQVETLLARNGLWADGKAQPAKVLLDNEDAASIYSSLNYLDNRDALHLIRDWFPLSTDSLSGYPDPYDNVDDLVKWLNVSPYPSFTDDTVDRLYVMRDYTVEGKEEALDIEGYRYYYKRIHISAEMPKSGRFLRIAADSLGLELTEITNGEITVLDAYDLQPVLSEFWSMERDYESLQLPPGARLIRLEGATTSILLALDDMFFIKDGESYKVGYINGSVFGGD